MTTEGTEGAATQAAEDDGWTWAFVEVMGHRKHAGRVREVEQFGVKMCRVDVPIKGNPEEFGWQTHMYPGTALFGVTPTDEGSALKYNQPYAPPALTRYRRDDDDDQRRHGGDDDSHVDGED